MDTIHFTRIATTSINAACLQQNGCPCMQQILVWAHQIDCVWTTNYSAVYRRLIVGYQPNCAQNAPAKKEAWEHWLGCRPRESSEWMQLEKFDVTESTSQRASLQYKHAIAENQWTTHSIFTYIYNEYIVQYIYIILKWLPYKFGYACIPLYSHVLKTFYDLPS